MIETIKQHRKIAIGVGAVLVAIAFILLATQDSGNTIEPMYSAEDDPIVYGPNSTTECFNDLVYAMDLAGSSDSQFIRYWGMQDPRYEFVLVTHSQWISDSFQVGNDAAIRAASTAIASVCKDGGEFEHFYETGY